MRVQKDLLKYSKFALGLGELDKDLSTDWIAFIYIQFFDNGVMRSPKRRNIISLVFKWICIFQPLSINKER